MPTAYLNLRNGVPERREAFVNGLQANGYSVTLGTTMRPKPGDILVTWNRIVEGRLAAEAFDSRKCKVIVTENATWGNNFAGRRWYTMARDYHNVAGRFPVGSPDRWHALGVELKPFRESGDVLILPSRGIGPQAYAMPRNWPSLAQKVFPQARIRLHPGRNVPARTLEQDIEGCPLIFTWGSGAAVIALMHGCKVWSDMPGWIAEQNNSEAGRLAMFERLAWAQWTLEEIDRGEAFRHLLTY